MKLLLCLVIALVLSTAFALHSRGQSQEPPKTERVQTDQGATADKGKSDQPAGQADNPQPIVPEVKAPVLKKEPGGRVAIIALRRLPNTGPFSFLARD